MGSHNIPDQYRYGKCKQCQQPWRCNPSNLTGEEKNQIYSQKNPAGALVEFLLDRCARGHAPTEMGTVPKNRFVTLGQYLLHQHPELGIGPNEIKEVYYDRK